MALKMMGPLRHSTPTRGLEIINYCRPLELECRRIAAEAYIRTQGKEKVSPAEMYTTKVTQKGHRQFCQEFLQEINYPLIDREIDTSIRKWTWSRKFEVDRTNLNHGEKYGLPIYDTRIQIYGGATIHHLNENQCTAGAGFSVNEGVITDSFSLGLFVEEGQAALYCLKRQAIWILKNQQEAAGERITLYTNYKPCLDALERVVTTSKLEYKTIQLLNAAAGKCDRLVIRWISGTNTLYKDALALAKTAASNGAQPVYDAPLPTKEMSSKHILIGTDKLWTILYHQLQYPERCRQTKDWWPKPDKERSNQILSLKRKQWGKMVQFMTGHNHLARHNNIVDPNESPTCSLCDYGYPQDTAHIIGECPDPHLMKIRIDIFGERYIVTWYSVTIFF